MKCTDSETLRIAIPNTGWLISKDRWTLRNILELASMRDYTDNGKDINFVSKDSKVEFFPVRARDIPEDLQNGI